MSFSSMLGGGADCGPMNPLQGAMKGTNADWSLQRDRFVSSSSAAAGPSTSQQQQANEAEQFYKQQPFDLATLGQQLPPQNQHQSAAWNASFSRALPATRQASPWTDEFAAHSNPGQQQQTRAFSPMQTRMPFRSMLPPPQLHHQQPIGQDSKGKGKAAEADLLAADNHAWEQAFAQFSPPAVSEQDQRAQPQESQEEEDDLVKNINAQWRDMHNSVRDSAQSDVDLAAWESQHSSVMQQLNDEGEDYLSAGRRPFSIEEMQQNPPEWQWLSEERVFEDFSDPFAEGMRLLHSGAPFIQVEQAFEEACRRDDQRVEAWTALGEALAADEKEHLAIRALEKAVSIKQSSAGPNAESAWISLAVSYINEAQDRQALHVLEQWLHRMYPGLKHASPLATMASQAEYENPWANHQKVINLFIDAARAGPAARAKDTRGPTVTDSIDADVQLGLGVLLYSNSDYDLAKDCFEAALSVRPDDYLLWNRLGATMANGGHPEDAIHAYRQALELRPNFTRSLYNLAVSCMNISCYKEAADYLLTALDMQGNNGKGSESDGLWQTLRRSFLCMDRQDLASLALPGADTSQFREKGFDF